MTSDSMAAATAKPVFGLSPRAIANLASVPAAGLISREGR
jgi:hypothetical protein